ncbi:MAG: chromate transporter [Clostridiales bacterium]|jgi:chromate transporter|nr:chromate transporter [Clostridiales bacterium]
MIYLSLFAEFFKVGLFSVGGGLATIPFLRQLINTRGWFTEAMLVDMIAVSESTPGPIGINMATYVGYTVAGPLGSIVASIAILTPSFIFICFIVKALGAFSENRFVKAAFYGLRPAVAALIASAFIGIILITVLSPGRFNGPGNFFSIINIKQFCLFTVLFFATNKWVKLHPAVFIAASAIIGVIFKF